MRSLLVICAVIALLNGISGKAIKKEAIRPKLIEGAYTVLVDYFRPQDDATDTFSYHLNIENFENDGPLYFYINDAGVYTTQWIEEGLMFDIAVEEGAALLTSDHRYYGDNIPTEEATWDDLTFLTIEQAIADIAFLIEAARIHLDDQYGKVIVWGTGYGGTLAVWAKQKYPHLIDGVWSSSAVFNRVPYTTAPYEHLGFVLQNYGSEECADRVEEAFDYIGDVIEGENAAELALLQEALFICDPINTDSIAEVGSIFEVLINYIGNFVATHDVSGINFFCTSMNSVPADAFASFARWLIFEYQLDVGPCLNLDYEDRLFWTQNEDWNAPPEFFGWRQSLYIICTQLGLLRTTSENGIFGNWITEEYHNTICEDAFGDNIEMEQLGPNIERLQIMHGGIDPSIENAIFTNGELDPFFPLGITNNMEEDSISINIPLVGRSADLSSLSSSDSQALFNAKQIIRERIIEWSADAIVPGKK